MDWILDNLQLIIVIAGAIAYWINQRAREKAGQEADYDEDGVPEARSPMERSQPPPLQRGGADFDQEERARRIREEIQRKIAERRGQVPPMPKLEPPAPVWEDRPVFREEPVPSRPEPVAVPVPPPLPSVTVAVDDEAAALDRQRRLAEEFELLEEQRRAARRVAEDTRRATVTAASGAAARSGASLGGRGIGAELRDPRALRRAIVLREVLSPPVALR